MSTHLELGTRYPTSIGAERYVRMLADAVKPVHERLVAEATGRLLHAAVWAHLAGKPIRVDSELDDGPAKDLALTGTGDDADLLVTFLPAAERVLQAAATSHRRINSHLSLELSVSFMADPAGGPWGYAYPFASNRNLRDIWSSLPGVEEYGYQNATDEQLEKLTEEQWNERGDTWDRVVASGRIADVAATYQALLPSAFVLYLSKRRWFMAAAAAGFEAAERERVDTRAQARTDHARQHIAWLMTRWGKPTDFEDVAAAQDRDDADLAARFR